jgi:succinylglutamate desuccinylase
MLPGFAGFEPIACGQVVARDRRGEVRVPIAGRMLMPRYQAAGEDGYFVVAEIASFSFTRRGT